MVVVGHGEHRAWLVTAVQVMVTHGGVDTTKLDTVSFQALLQSHEMSVDVII